MPPALRPDRVPRGVVHRQADSLDVGPNPGCIGSAPLVDASGRDAHVSSPNPASNYGDAINPNTGQHELEVGGDSYDPAGDSSNNVLSPCAQPATTL